jgi:quinol monooxygenase YgiN
MTQLVVIAKIPCQPGARDEVVAEMRAMLAHVESEPGTLQYVLHEDIGDADTLWVYEVYTDQAALDAHSTSDAMKTLIGAIGGRLGGAPELIMATPVGGKGLHSA